MDKKLSIIYAFRNRDVERVQLSMESLHAQKFQNFEVVFVDYGSEAETAAKVQKTLKNFEFARYLYFPVFAGHCRLSRHSRCVENTADSLGRPSANL